MANLNGRMRGQAAMEYLMTYGWALLVIVIVIAILLIINPFSAPQGCRFDDLGFSCTNPVVDTQGNLYMSITNNQNNAITGVYALCTQDTSPSVPDTSRAQPVADNVLRQGSVDISGKGINCLTISSSLQQGQQFSAKLWLFYHNEGEPSNYPFHTASASFTTKVGATG